MRSGFLVTLDCIIISALNSARSTYSNATSQMAMCFDKLASVSPPPEAVSLYKKCLDILMAVHGRKNAEGHPDVVRVLRLLAEAQYGMHEYDAAYATACCAINFCQKMTPAPIGLFDIMSIAAKSAEGTQTHSRDALKLYEEMLMAVRGLYDKKSCAISASESSVPSDVLDLEARAKELTNKCVSLSLTSAAPHYSNLVRSVTSGTAINTKVLPRDMFVDVINELWSSRPSVVMSGLLEAGRGGDAAAIGKLACAWKLVQDKFVTFSE